MNKFSSSDAFFDCSEPLAHPENSQFDSVRGRLIALTSLFKALAIIPLAFISKLFQTALLTCGVGLGFALLAVTLCSVPSIREFFVNRIAVLAKDLADWILWPAAVLFCIGKLLLASTIHPAFYFRL